MHVCDFDIFNIVGNFEMLFNIEYASITVVAKFVTMITKSVTMFIDI